MKKLFILMMLISSEGWAESNINPLPFLENDRCDVDEYCYQGIVYIKQRCVGGLSAKFLPSGKVVTCFPTNSKAK